MTKQISRLRESVKRKYNAFKQGALESNQLLEKQYKPLIKELRKTSTIDDSDSSRVKKEIKGEDDEGYEYDEVDTVSSFKPDVHSSPQNNKTLVSNASHIDNEEEVFGDAMSDDEENPDVSAHVDTLEGIESASRFIDSTFEHELTKKYMKKMMKDIGGHKNTIDHTFGPRYEGSTLMIGDSKLSFDSDGSIRVRDIKYRPSEGLYELVFKRIPDDMKYTEGDLYAYKNILQKTNAHKVGYNSRSRIRRDTSLKYQHIIKVLFPPRQQHQLEPQKARYHTGRGGGKGSVITKTVNSPDKSRCGDPNDMTERLALLVTSTEVGNKGHTNEIINIIDSLKKDGIISGNGNKRYWELLQ